MGRSLLNRRCKKCKLLKPIEKFHKYYGEARKKEARRHICGPCKYKREIELHGDDKKWIDRRKKTVKKYYKLNPHLGKIKAYQHSDKIKNRKSITLTEGRNLIENNNCYYCTESDIKNLGLDRIDNKLGHEISNVVVCCEKCNFILSDIPKQAKELLKTGLKLIKQQGALQKWTIPTKRLLPRGEA